MEPKNSLLPEQIKKKLSSRWIAREISFYHKLDSTNLTALELAQQGVPEGTIVLAEQQLHGRGRGNRSWHSPAGVGVYCSIILRPRLSPAKAQVLTLMTAVAVAKAIHIKVGLSPVIVDLMRRNIITALATNGACIIHDFELSFVGKTSEDVDKELFKGHTTNEIKKLKYTSPPSYRYIDVNLYRITIDLEEVSDIQVEKSLFVLSVLPSY